MPPTSTSSTRLALLATLSSVAVGARAGGQSTWARTGPTASVSPYAGERVGTRAAASSLTRLGGPDRRVGHR